MMIESQFIFIPASLKKMGLHSSQGFALQMLESFLSHTADLQTSSWSQFRINFPLGHRSELISIGDDTIVVVSSVQTKAIATIVLSLKLIILRKNYYALHMQRQFFPLDDCICKLIYWMLSGWNNTHF